MKKSNIEGWKDVFSFTVSQTLKSKSFIITYLITLAFIFVFLHSSNKLSSGDEIDSNQSLAIQKVYVFNETSLPNMDFSWMRKIESVKHIDYEILEDNKDSILTNIEEGEDTSVVLTMTENEGFYSLDFLKANDGPVEDQDVDHLGFLIMEEFENFRMNTVDIDKEVLDILNANVTTDVLYSDVDGSPIFEEDTTISDNEYWFVYAILFVIMMINVMGGAQISTSIIMEKSSRVVENLLISIRPLALIIGKVLAMLTVVIGQTISYILVFTISNKLTSAGGNGSPLARLLPEDVFSNLSVSNIILCFVVAILGFIFYGILAGLTGATVSKMEEANSGMTLFYICIYAGLYIGIIAAGSMMNTGMNAFSTFAIIFPLSSPYVLPGMILIGEVTWPIFSIALALLIIFIALLFRFTANVYETLILYNGNRIKIKELFKMSRSA